MQNHLVELFLSYARCYSNQISQIYELEYCVIWCCAHKMKHTLVDEDGISFKSNGNFHLGKKLILGAMEVNFRLKTEKLFWSSWSLK